jgi:S-formylglutathione hydrolase FrmB
MKWIMVRLLGAIWGILLNGFPAFCQERILEVHFPSVALEREAVFSIVLPSGPAPTGGYPVLVVLHGLGRNHHTLLDQPATRAMLEAQPYVVVLPDSKRGCWIDSEISGQKFESMLLEVIRYVGLHYPVSKDSKQWGMLGWSMGGFGTIHFVQRHPDTVSFAGSIIGLLDFPRVEGLPEDQRFTVDTKVFGSDPAKWERYNPRLHVQELAHEKLILVVGMQAFDRTMNDNFIDAALKAGLHPEVHRIEGGHVFPTVQQGLEILLPRAAKHFTRQE